MNIPLLSPYHTIVLANGSFPKHPVPLTFLHQAEHIVCCDGATEELLNYGLKPHYIAGDLDSLSPEIKEQYRHLLFHDPDQETNDLTKAVSFCLKNRWNNITILGATGKREDHTIANISLLCDYAEKANVQMITDYGVFVPLLQTSCFDSFPGQQVSIFSVTTDTAYTLSRLKYLLTDQALSSWWKGSLNEACSDHFSITMNKGKALVFREHQQV